MDSSITFRDISVEESPGEAHIIIGAVDKNQDGTWRTRPIDIVKESLAVGKLMQISKNDSERQDLLIKELRSDLGSLLSRVLYLERGVKDGQAFQGFAHKDDQAGAG